MVGQGRCQNFIIMRKRAEERWRETAEGELPAGPWMATLVVICAV